ncbi:hypothetical protein FACS189451_03560 [Bacteroidia bacterium]|nr:hypothetical protein FACS189451_03560 [Bacteroidia bacterium]
MNEFICSWGNSVIVVTVLCLIIFLFVFIKSFRYFGGQKKKRISYSIILFITNIIIVFALMYVFFYMPLKITLNEKEIFVDQVKSGFSITYDEISEIRRYTKNDSKNTIRVFGSGGLFGYIGKFKNSQIGSIQMYATDISNRVLIRTKSKNINYVISCKDPDIFIDKVKINLKKL